MNVLVVLGLSIFWQPAIVFHSIFVASHSCTALRKAAIEKAKNKS